MKKGGEKEVERRPANLEAGPCWSYGIINQTILIEGGAR